MTRVMTIRLKDMRFHSRIGVEEQERIVGNEFRVDIDLIYDAGVFRMEELDSTISYADVYNIVEDEMRNEWLLLESVAVKIFERITGRWDIVNELKITIYKVAPPISGITGECGIEYFWKKS